MSKRKARARREDPRTMTREQYVRHCMQRYRRAYIDAVQRYERKHANSPYTPKRWVYR